MFPVKRDRHWLPDIFSDFFDNEWMARTNATAPAINVIETDKEYMVEMAAPGMTRDDFSIRINDRNQLIVTMEKHIEHGHRHFKHEGRSADDAHGREWDDADKSAAKQADGRFLRREFSYTRFQQAMILPENIRQERIAAKVENGVLSISIPKVRPHAEPVKERQISIK